MCFEIWHTGDSTYSIYFWIYYTITILTYGKIKIRCTKDLILSPSIVYMYTTCLLIHELYILSFYNIPKGDTFLLSPHLFICQSFYFWLWWNNVLIRHDSFSTHKQHCCPLSATFSNLIISRIVIMTMLKFIEYQIIVKVTDNSPLFLIL